MQNDTGIRRGQNTKKEIWQARMRLDIQIHSINVSKAKIIITYYL